MLVRRRFGGCWREGVRANTANRGGVFFRKNDERPEHPSGAPAIVPGMLSTEPQSNP